MKRPRGIKDWVTPTWTEYELWRLNRWAEAEAVKPYFGEVNGPPDDWQEAPSWDVDFKIAKKKGRLYIDVYIAYLRQDLKNGKVKWWDLGPVPDDLMGSNAPPKPKPKPRPKGKSSKS